MAADLLRSRIPRTPDHRLRAGAITKGVRESRRRPPRRYLHRAAAGCCLRPTRLTVSQPLKMHPDVGVEAQIAGA